MDMSLRPRGILRRPVVNLECRRPPPPDLRAGKRSRGPAVCPGFAMATGLRMSRNPIYLPAHSPEDWRLLLTDPALHWEKDRSAQALAYRWQLADGIPAAPRAALEPAMGQLEVL